MRTSDPLFRAVNRPRPRVPLLLSPADSYGFHRESAVSNEQLAPLKELSLPPIGFATEYQLATHGGSV